MSRLSAVLLLACSAVCLAQALEVKAGSTVYIEPMNGYEGYLAAALLKKHVPLVVVTDKAKADYIIASSLDSREGDKPLVVVGNSMPRRRDLGETSANIRVIDAKTSAVVFSYTSSKNSADNFQSTAEGCAKHLREFIEKKK